MREAAWPARSHSTTSCSEPYVLRKNDVCIIDRTLAPPSPPLIFILCHSENDARIPFHVEGGFDSWHARSTVQSPAKGGLVDGYPSGPMSSACHPHHPYCVAACNEFAATVAPHLSIMPLSCPLLRYNRPSRFVPLFSFSLLFFIPFLFCALRIQPLASPSSCPSISPLLSWKPCPSTG